MKKLINKLDYTDLLLLVKEKGIKVPVKIAFIDEAQDLTSEQFAIIEMIGKHGNVFVVADDDQSIYKFRGANINNILDFQKDYQGAVRITLDENYRSTSTILDAANAVIAKNKERKGKKLWTDGDKGELIKSVKLQNQLEEAKYISDTVATLHEDGEEFRNAFFLNGHFSPMGYALSAKLIVSYIDYIIRHNMNDFKQVGFIGTPFYMDYLDEKK